MALESESTVNEVHTPVLATIVHLSDLHFGKVYDATLGRFLLDSIPRLRPDALVVSGDLADSPRPRWFRAASRFLTDLQTACEKESSIRPNLVVVPGNHDRKLLGNISLGFFARLIFDVYFGDWPEQPKTPSFRERRERYRKLLREARDKVFKPSYVSKQSVRSKMVANGNVVFVLYDSNDAYWLASGRVKPAQISETAMLFRQTSTSKTSNPQALRIAVVHHHPLAIPYADKRSLTNLEAFLVLENSGTFMREMVANDFDCILHGHKHYSNFSRVAYHLNAEDRGEVGVLAAGTSTVKGGNAFGKNSYNLIRLYRHGRVEIEMWEYGTGQSSQYAFHTPYAFELHTVQGIKQRAFRRNYEKHQVKARRLLVTKKLFADGRSKVSHRVEGLVVGDRNLEGLMIAYHSSTGLVRKPEVDRKTALGGMRWESLESPVQKGASIEGRLAAGRQLKGRIRFNRAVGRLDAPLDFQFDYFVINSDAMSDWEFDLFYSPEMTESWKGEPILEPMEWFECDVWYPIERLVLRIELPPNILESPNIDVFYNPDIPRMELVVDRTLTLSATNNWERDAFMLKAEQQNLRLEGNNTWILEIDKPPVGYRYSIKWFLPKASSKILPSKVIAEAQTYRELLLRHRELRKEEQGGDYLGDVREMLTFLYELLRKSFPCIDKEEKFHLSLMTYDQRKRRLAVVDGLMNGLELPSSYWQFWVPPGIGNAGACLKTGDPSVYLAAEVSEESNYYLPVEESDPHQVLVSVPLNHPDFANIQGEKSEDIGLERKRQVIAVANLGSNSISSSLRRLYPDNERLAEAAKQDLTELQGVCQEGFEQILKVLVNRGG